MAAEVASASHTERKNSGHAAALTTARELALLVLVSFFLLFFQLSSLGLVGADEPRYAQIAREMLARHDWVLPVLNGKPWLEKPVLYYWEAMVAYKVFGVTDWAARLPGVFSAGLMIAGIYAFMRRFRPGAQFEAAVIAASSAAVIGFGRAASTDMPLASAFTLAMLAWAAWYQTQQRRWLACFYFFIALGVLAKGPVAAGLAALVVVLLAAVKRKPAMVWRTLWLPGILLFLAVALPWYVAVQARAPEFFRVFLLEHNLARFETKVFGHRQPFWYYAGVLPLTVLPWLAVWVPAVVATLARKLRVAADDSAESADLEDFLLLWMVVPVVFFSFSGSKLPGYILPSVPACAMLMAGYLRWKRREGQLSWRLVIAHALVCGAVMWAVLASPYLVRHLRPPQPAGMILWLAAAVAVFVAFVVHRFRGARLRVLTIATLVPVILGVTFLLRVANPSLDAEISARPVARAIASLPLKGAPLAGTGISRETEYGLNFYCNQPVARYERGETPPGDHLLIARGGAERAANMPGRRLVRVGGYAPQRLEFFWVTSSAK